MTGIILPFGPGYQDAGNAGNEPQSCLILGLVPIPGCPSFTRVEYPPLPSVQPGQDGNDQPPPNIPSTPVTITQHVDTPPSVTLYINSSTIQTSTSTRLVTVLQTTVTVQKVPTPSLSISSDIPKSLQQDPTQTSQEPQATSSAIGSVQTRSGLSAKATAGIALGVLAAFALLLLCAKCFWSRRRRRNNKIEDYNWLSVDLQSSRSSVLSSMYKSKLIDDVPRTYEAQPKDDTHGEMFKEPQSSSGAGTATRFNIVQPMQAALIDPNPFRRPSMQALNSPPALLPTHVPGWPLQPQRGLP